MTDSGDQTTWAIREFGGVHLGDARRTERLIQTGNGADRDKILGFLGGFEEQAKAARLFDDAYPVPSFTDWTAEQLKAYGTALKLVVQHATAADPTPLAEVRDRLTAALRTCCRS